MSAVAPTRTPEQIAADLEAVDERMARYSPAAMKAERARLETELHETLEREREEAQAFREATSEYVEQLEAAYEKASAAMETFVGAVERVQEIRMQEAAWPTDNKLGAIANRPEPWHVRAIRRDELRTLNERFNRAVHSRW